MKYTIEWSENKTTSTGKEKMDATLKDESGVIHQSVTIWGDFPNFKDLKTGHSVLGDLVPAKDPKWGPTLYPTKAETSNVGHPVRSQGAISKAMDKKAEYIATAQENKEIGIMTSSTIRMAVDIALAESHGLPFDVGVFKGRVKQWRQWLIAEWSDLEAPPFN